MKWVKAKARRGNETETGYSLVDDSEKIYIMLDRLEDGSWEWSTYGIDLYIAGRFDESWSVEEAILDIKETLVPMLMETADFCLALAGNIPEEIEI